MSRVGNNPITIPEGVSVEISENKIIVKGKLGEIEREFSDVTVKIFNIDGKVLQAHNYSNVKDASYSYNVKDLTAGVYLLHVQTDQGQTMKKVIIK